MSIEIPDLLAIFFSGFGVTLCLVVGIQVLFRKTGVGQTNILLGLLLILNALTLGNALLSMTGISSQYQFLYFLPLNFSLSLGPLFYFFIRSRVQPSFRLQKKHLIHAVLPLMQFLFYLSIGFRSMEFKSYMWRNWVGPYIQFIEEGLLLILGVAYLYASYRLLTKEVPEALWKKPVYKWLKRFTLSLGFLFLLSEIYEITDWILYGFYEYNLFNTPWMAFPLKLTYAGISLIIGYNAFIHQHQALIIPKATSPPKSSLKSKIEELFEVKKVHLDPELNLESFSKMLGIPKNTVSSTLSQQGETFRGILNRYRVKEFVQYIEQGKHDQYTLLSLAMESGFNSKASFNRVFKSLKGVSPSTYLSEKRSTISS